MLICFFDQEGIVHREFVPPGMTISADFYCDVLRRLRENVRRKRPQKWRNQNLIIHHDNAPVHRSFKFCSFWPRTTWQWSPIPHTHPIRPPVIFPLPQAQASDGGPNIRHHWRDSTGIAAGTWHNSKKGLPGMLPSMAETLGPLCSCKRGVLWRWWRKSTSKVSKLLFTSTVLELLDTHLYFISVTVIRPVSLALLVQFSLQHNKAGLASVLCSFFPWFL